MWEWEWEWEEGRESKAPPLFRAGAETSPTEWSLRRAWGGGVGGPLRAPCYFTGGRHLPPDLVKGKGRASPAP